MKCYTLECLRMNPNMSQEYQESICSLHEAPDAFLQRLDGFIDSSTLRPATTMISTRMDMAAMASLGLFLKKPGFLYLIAQNAPFKSNQKVGQAGKPHCTTPGFPWSKSLWLRLSRKVPQSVVQCQAQDMNTTQHHHHHQPP